MLSQMWTIFIKDVKTDIRRKENFLSTFFFAVVILLIFNFAFESDSKSLAKFLPGIFWATFLLSGVLGLNKSFQQEKENSCMEAILLCPIDRGVIYVGKFAGNLFFLTSVQLLLIPLFGLFFSEAIFSNFVPLFLLSILSSIGFCALGTLLAALTTDLKFNEILLPLLLFPLIIPILLASIRVSQGIMDNEEFQNYFDWIKLLLGFDLIFLIASYLTFDFIMEV